MPIDKFGRHFHTHEDPQSFLAEVRDLAQIKSESVLTLLANRTDSKKYFILLGDQEISGKRVFKCPINGTIRNVRLSIKDVEIYINEKLIPTTSLIGFKLNYDDHISIQWSKPNFSTVLLVQLLVLSPLHYT